MSPALFNIWENLVPYPFLINENTKFPVLRFWVNSVPNLEVIFKSLSQNSHELFEPLKEWKNHFITFHYQKGYKIEKKAFIYGLFWGCLLKAIYIKSYIF